jgi:PAS domain S-box-containing protein
VKIRSYLIALILSLFVPFTIFAGAIAYTLAERERAASVDGVQSTARALAIAVDRNVADISNSLSVLATAELLHVRELEGLHRFANRVVHERPEIRRLLLVQADGRLLFDTEVPYRETAETWVWSAHLARALASGVPTIGKDIAGYDALDPASTAVFVPARIDGAIRYALVGILDLSVIGAIFSDQKLPPDWTGVVLDADSAILSRSRSPELFVGLAAPSALAAAIHGKDEGIAEYQTQEGWPTLAGFARSGLTGWTVVLGMPATAANIAAGRVLTVVVGIGAVLSLAALAIASFLGRRISRAVLGLLEPAMAIAQGAPIRMPGRSGITEIERVMEKLKAASDILAEREAERNRAEERYRLASLAANDFLWEYDVQTGRAVRSANFLAAFGYTADDNTNTRQWWLDHIHPEDAPRVIASSDAFIASDRSAWSAEYRLRKADGTYAYIFDRAYCIRDEQGRPLRLVGAKVDLTAHRMVEEQLRQTQKMEALGQLTGGIAHDFNNLLAVLIGNLELAVRKQRQGKLATELDESSLRTAVRGAALTRQLLAFARRQPLRPAVLDLAQLVQGMAQILDPALGSRITLKFEIAPEPCWVEIDSGQCEAALLNLALNARDAMPEGGVLTIRVRGADDRVEVSVCDTGIGMSPEIQARAFEPFFTTKPVGKGSGLGLSMVYGFVRQTGGRIRIDSAPGQGTTVTLSFRRAEPPASALPAREGPTVRFQDLRILLVEDDAEVCETVHAMLADLGAIVVVAAGGAAALAVLEAGPAPDVMLTDIVMPGMDGLALADAARAARPDMKIIFMSGNAELDARTMSAVSTALLLVKPFRTIDLAAALCEAHTRT